MVRDCTTVPSSKFGNLVFEVDNKKLGRLAKDFREEAGVKAVDVSRRLNLSRAQICFLEGGTKAWDLKLLKRYLRAVRELLDEVS